MSVAYPRGKQLGPDDLNIFLEDSNGRPANAQEISYAIYDFTTGLEVLVGVPRRVPVNPQIGSYYASLVIPLGANLGPYRIRWTFREVVGGPINQVVQEFDVVDQEIVQACTKGCEDDLIRSMRILLRDNRPDRNYHFRPPAHETTIQQFNQVFGFIWEDDELLEYLRRSVDMIAATPPATVFTDPCAMMQCYPHWRTLLIDGAVMHALFALTVNWIADEFSLSGDSSVDVRLPDGRVVPVTLEELYDICKDE